MEQINITIGTAGHIDHGKTALVKCLTGCDTDRLKEEKERGMSIELGFAPCKIADTQVGIVDVPGHENFIKTMVAGANGMDAVILVVAADDGVMPQTREHLDILTLLGVRQGIVALTKIDRVASQQREAVRASVAALLRGTFLEDAPILPVSNVTGEGFDPFLEALWTLVRAVKPRPIDGVFRLPLERAFSVQGYGTVVAGIPVSGSARVGDEIVLLPQGLAGRIRRIEVYGQESQVVQAGQCAAINVGHWDHRVIRRGDTLAAPGFFAPMEWFVCSLRLLSDVRKGDRHRLCEAPEGPFRQTEPVPFSGLPFSDLPREKLLLRSGAEVKFHTGTSEVAAMFYPLRGSQMAGGDCGLIQVRTKTPVVAGPGDHFLLRTPSPVRTIGGGLIVEAVQRRLKGRQPGVCEDLAARADAVLDERRFVEYCVRSGNAERGTGPICAQSGTDRRLVAGRSGKLDLSPSLRSPAVAESAIAVRTKVPVARLQEILTELTGRGVVFAIAAKQYIHRETAAAVQREILAAVGDYHRQWPESPGIPPDQLRQSVGLDKVVLDELVARLKGDGRLAERNQRLTLPEHRVTFRDEDGELLETIEGLFRQAKFSPPAREEVVRQTGAAPKRVEKILGLLREHQRLVQVEEGLLFHREAVDRAREMLAEHFRKEGRLESVQFKYLLDTTRKYALPLLDYLDRIGVTRRVGNTRYPRQSPP